MLNAATVKCRASNWIVGSSFQWIQRIFERLLVLATYQWTKTPFCVNPLSLGGANCRVFPCPPLHDHGLLPPWAQGFSWRTRHLPLYHPQGSPWGLKLSGVISYYYGNFDSHQCTRQCISNSTRLETHHFHVRKTEGKPHEIGKAHCLL